MVSAARSSSAPDLLVLLARLWPLWALLGLVFVVRAIVLVRDERRFRRSGLAEIDLLDGTAFERRLALLFGALGYRARRTGAAGGDYGCDLLVEREGKRAVVQAKRWHKNVGVRAVQEASAARAFYGAGDAYVVTNRGFTPQARSLAAANDVVLWGREELLERLLRTQRRPTTPSAESRSACARCGRHVSERVHDYCVRNRERFGGLVYCYDHQRSL